MAIMACAIAKKTLNPNDGCVVRGQKTFAYKFPWKPMKKAKNRKLQETPHSTISIELDEKKMPRKFDILDCARLPPCRAEKPL